MSDLRRHQLADHAFELDALGYTIVPDVLTREQIESLTQSLVAIASSDEGATVDLIEGETHKDRTQEVTMLFARGNDEMRAAIANPRTLPLIRYLLGTSAVLSSYTGYVKGPGRCDLGVHSDTAYVPDPMPPYAQLANVNLLLTDYTEENGCLTMVPGSHRYSFRPRGGQGSNEQVAIVAPAGSAVVFHGNTWHAAYPRTVSGVRLTLSILYSRIYMRTQEDYRDAFDGDLADRLPESLRALALPDLPTGWTSPDHAKEIVNRRRENGRHYYRTRGQHV